MKYSLKFNDLTSKQLGLLLHAVNEINGKYDPDKSNQLPEPEIVPQSTEPTQVVETESVKMKAEPPRSTSTIGATTA